MNNRPSVAATAKRKQSTIAKCGAIYKVYVVISFICLEIVTQAILQSSTGRGGAPTIRRRRRADAKFSAAARLVRRQALLRHSYSPINWRSAQLAPQQQQ